MRAIPKLIYLVPSSQKKNGISPSLHRIGGAMPHGVLMEGSFQSCLMPVRAHMLDFFGDFHSGELANFWGDLQHLGKPIDIPVQGV